MSGPIVRKYGFPNFDKIFGERPLQHGADESEEAEEFVKPASDTKAKARTTIQKKKAPAQKKAP